MNLLKKIIIILITVIITIVLIGNTKKNLYIIPKATLTKPINIGVLLFKLDHPYTMLIKQSLENIQKENENKVKFTFFDGKDNQAIQNESIDLLIRNKVDLLLINLVDTSENVIQGIIDKAKPENVPFILFNSVPLKTDVLKSYDKAVVIGTDSKQSGILQGKILVDLWNNNKQVIDKNKDNILQYIIFKGKINNETTINRTQYSISTINDAGIKTQELASNTCNWEEECAKITMEALILRYEKSIEAIISNNDAMAIGAIDALQKYGYNKGDKTKTIPIVGIDGIPEVQSLIGKGFMTGTVFQDYDAMAKALYIVGMNLINNRNPFENIEYNIDEKGVVRIPYKEYVP